MKKLKLLAVIVAVVLAASAQAQGDPLRAALEESKASGKGLTLFVNGQSIPAVVVSVDDRYVVARSQAQGAIVIRLDRIDGVAGFIAPKAQ